MAKKSKSLHAILGTGGRIKKRPVRQSPSTAASPSRAAASSSSSQAQSPVPKRVQPAETPGTDDDDGEDDGNWDDGGGIGDNEPDYFDEQLSDNGLLQALVTDATLTDVVQAMRLARTRMFSPVPSRGFHSSRTTALHARRATCPPLTTRDHLNALLSSPSAVERELAGLVRTGVVRRITVARREEVEMLVEGRGLEDMVARAEGVGDAAKEEFVAWLRANPGDSMVPKGGLREQCAAALVREGFLVGRRALDGMRTAGERERLRLRPDGPSSTMSLDRVSRAASGSLDAVGGVSRAIAKGGGNRGGRGGADDVMTSEDLSLAVPGQGTFLMLCTAGVEHLVNLVTSRARFHQVPETTLREWWDAAAASVAAGGGAPNKGSSSSSSRRRRSAQARLQAGTASYSGGASAGVVTPWRTVKWKKLDGLGFEWVLEEAVGRGVVEVFDAGPVGRGVRVVGSEDAIHR